MSKITRDTILDAIDFDEDEWSGKDGGGWSTREIKNAMVAAYNRALEDVVNYGEGKLEWNGLADEFEPVVDKDSILKLKI